VQVIPPTGTGVSYTYDEADRLTSAAYGSASTTLDNDLAGRKISMSDADMGSWSYTYDALGNLTRQKDARGQRICLYYDPLNRLLGKHYRPDDNWTVQGAMQAAVYGGFGAAFDVGGSLAVQSFGSQALSNVYSSSSPKGYIPRKGFGDIVRTTARDRSGAALIKTGSGLISGVGSSITSWLLSQRLKAE